MGCSWSSEEEEPRAVSQAEYEKLAITLQTFKFERTLGKGGFGKVNAVTFTPTQRWFAMKTMKKITVLEKNGLAMLYNERNLLMALENQWIVNAFGAFDDIHNVYLLMDLCLGGDLNYHLGIEKTFMEKRVKFYAAQILLALKYLHSKNVLHRDLKPANLLLDHTGYLMVTDLGVSSYMKDGRCESTSGTKAYMSPEMLKSTHGICADFYALGVTLYQMIHGKRPGEGSLHDNITKLNCSTHCKAFIRGLLEPSEKDRLGYPNGVSDIVTHPWLSDAVDGIDFDQLERREIEPDFLPDITRANCETDTDDFAAALFLPPPEEEPPSADQQHHFKEYSSFVGDRKRMYESGKFIPKKPSTIKEITRKFSRGKIAPGSEGDSSSTKDEMRRRSQLVQGEKTKSSNVNSPSRTSTNGSP